MNFRNDRFYLTVDAVVFTILDRQLKVLLIKRKNEPFVGKFALPGGFVNIDEELKDAIHRELKEETGVRSIYLSVLEPAAGLNRDPRGRIISVPFLALIDGENVRLHASTDAELAKWFPIYELPEPAFDHKKIIEHALSELRFEIQITNIACQLLPEKFTLAELQNAYEIILDKKLDKRNFRKRIKALSILRPLREFRMEGAHRPAQLFEFKNKKYDYVKEKVHIFV
jgi:8-oxo-dGTP diphosphatase